MKFKYHIWTESKNFAGQKVLIPKPNAKLIAANAIDVSDVDVAKVESSGAPSEKLRIGQKFATTKVQNSIAG